MIAVETVAFDGVTKFVLTFPPSQLSWTAKTTILRQGWKTNYCWHTAYVLDKGTIMWVPHGTLRSLIQSRRVILLPTRLRPHHFTILKQQQENFWSECGMHTTLWTSRNRETERDMQMHPLEYSSPRSESYFLETNLCIVWNYSFKFRKKWATDAQRMRLLKTKTEKVLRQPSESWTFKDPKD